MKKKYFIRLYRAHDLDLITFIQTHRFNLNHAIYVALTSFSNNEVFIIAVPPKRDVVASKLKRVYSYTLVLDVEKDIKAIQVLDKIKNGYKNNFIKNLLRLYLCYPLAEAFLEDEAEMAFFENQFKEFKKNRRLAEAGFEKKARKKKLSRPDGVNTKSGAVSLTESPLTLKEEQLINNIKPDGENSIILPKEQTLPEEVSAKSLEDAVEDDDETITNMFMNINC